MEGLHVPDHVLLSHRLAELRDVATPSPRFRQAVTEQHVVGDMQALHRGRSLQRSVRRSSMRRLRA